MLRYEKEINAFAHSTGITISDKLKEFLDTVHADKQKNKSMWVYLNCIQGDQTHWMIDMLSENRWLAALNFSKVEMVNVYKQSYSLASIDNVIEVEIRTLIKCFEAYVERNF